MKGSGTEPVKEKEDMLICSTMKQGRACIFMRKSGCSYNSGKCCLIVQACEGCDNVEVFAAGTFCKIFAEPELKWNSGACNMASHAQSSAQEDAPAKKVNPLKASKRSQR